MCWPGASAGPGAVRSGMESTRTRARSIRTPLGEMVGVAGDQGLLLLKFARGAWSPRAAAVRHAAEPGTNRVLEELEAELGAYFAGVLREFRTPVEAAGSPFERRVWAALRAIPFGTTCSYAALARRVECAGGSRAVGRANATNPVAILVPCHRVVRTDGTLCGYAGGIDRKRALLDLECSFAGDASAPPLFARAG